MAAAADGQPVTSDLGGGFVYLRRADGASAVFATGLADTGAIGFMSTADVNARDERSLRDWLRMWAIPDQARVLRVEQVHGGDVIAAPDEDASHSADGMWTRNPLDVLVVKAADCAPVWVVDRGDKAIALVHAGWRGVAAGIVERAIAVLERQGGDPATFAVAVGPHIGPCCFEIGPEVAAQFRDDPGAVASAAGLRVDRRRPDSEALDLSAAIAYRAASSGVHPSDILVCTACTRCRADIFHSYRRNGTGGPLMAAVGAVTGAA